MLKNIPYQKGSLMKRFIIFLAVITASSAFANPTYTRFTNNKYQRVYFGPTAHYLGIRVRSNTPSSLIPIDQGRKLRGALAGVVGGYEYQKLRSLYLASKFSYAWGDVTRNGIPDRYIHDGWTEGRIGYNMISLQGSRLTATPYTGFGFHLTSHSRTGGTPSQKFKYFRYYVPVGISLDYIAYTFFHIGFDFTWQPDVDATVKIKGTSARWVLRNSTGVYHVTMPFVFYLGKCNWFEIRVEPFWRKVRDGRTDILANNGTTLLPANTNIYWGGNLTMAFRF